MAKVLCVPPEEIPNTVKLVLLLSFGLFNGKVSTFQCSNTNLMLYNPEKLCFGFLVSLGLAHGR